MKVHWSAKHFNDGTLECKIFLMKVHWSAKHF